jgi:LysR family glycine cleavage system transcriptional activator
VADRIPPLNALRAFEVAGRHLSFTQAAAELRVTPSAISRQIKLLEDHLAVPLFRRGYREVALTDVGREYLDTLTDVFTRIAATTRRVAATREQRPLHIFASMMFTMHWLMPRLAGFGGTPTGGIRLSTSISAEPNPFSDDDVDVAIYLGQAEWPGMVCHRLLSGRTVPICSPGLVAAKPLRGLDDLPQHTLLHSAVFPDSWGKWLAGTGWADVAELPKITFGSSSLVYQAAREGVGVALGRVALIQADIAAGRLLTPIDRTVEDGNAYYLAYRPSRSRDVILWPFLQWIMAQVSRNDHCSLGSIGGRCDLERQRG